MDLLFRPDFFNAVLLAMALLAAVVFVALFRVTAPYGMAFSGKWGPSLSNRTAWVLMEAPAFVVMALIWGSAPAAGTAAAVMAALYMAHYFQRSFIFPLLMRGKSRMPVCIMAMGMLFNAINAYLIGAWLFHIAPPYPDSWLRSPQFVAGTLLFLAGMWINLDSDRRVRRLRKPGDTRHYIPRGGMFRFVTSANYFGELTEWVGFAILTWSAPGALFALWTFANLAPRARKLHQRYIDEFGEQYEKLGRRYILPFIF